MSTPVDGWKRVLVVQTWGIGDMVMSTPMLRSLRARLPNARIEVIAGADRVADVVRKSPLCDEVHVIGGGRQRYLRLASLLWKLRRERPDAAFLSVGMSPLIARGLRWVTGVPIVAGSTGTTRPGGFTHWVPHDLTRHRVLVNQDMMRTAIADVGEPGTPYFSVPPEADAEGGRFWRESGLDGQPVLTLHAGAGGVVGRDKRIPPERCVEVMSGLLERFERLRVLLLVGPDEMDALPGLTARPHPRLLVAAGKPLAVVAALIRRSRVFLGSDSGLGHVASAFEVPSVTVFGPTYPERIRPWGPGITVVSTDERPACMPCYDTPLFGKCPYGQKCMTAVRPDAVVRAVIDRLAL